MGLFRLPIPVCIADSSMIVVKAGGTTTDVTPRELFLGEAEQSVLVMLSTSLKLDCKTVAPD